VIDEGRAATCLERLVVVSQEAGGASSGGT
jgi:hypothetical protein